jgi:hypothetical protein
MSFTPENAAIKVTKTLEEQLSAASCPSQVQEILHSHALLQKAVRVDWDGCLYPAPQSAALQKTIVLNGVSHDVRGNSEKELLEAEASVYREHLSQPVATSSTTQQPAAEDQNLSRVELEVKFKRGEISTNEYIEQSGAVRDYLERQGIAGDGTDTVTFTKSWEEATNEFLHSEAGASWPGGAQNLQTISKTVSELGLVDCPSVESLASAYEVMRERKLIVPTPATIAHEKISSATTHEEIRAAAHQASGIFGRR